MKFADVTRGRPFAKDPAVVRWHDRYWMYYSIPPYGDGRTGDGWAMGIATSVDLDHWEVVGSITPDVQAPYEAKGLCAPGAMVKDGRIHLFYQTYGNFPNDAICHAVSDDGIHFERNPDNPVFAPSGKWNNGRAIDADVIAWGDQLLLYYASRDPSGTRQIVGVAAAPLDSDYRRSAWTMLGDGPILVPQLAWERACIEAPALCTHDGRLYMFYAGAYNNEPQQIGCAVSDDGVQWQRLFEQPLLPCGAPNTWNASESGHPYYFEDEDGSGHLFYQGNNDNGQTWYLSRQVVSFHEGLPQLSEPSLR